ncbi:hypothetical protein BHM03_00041483 [Ensete ventricosum]|nr:hypothetical protein BHM03_00041483 [Ensete ventricosum]
MTQRMGTCGRDVPLETQFLLVEADGSASQEASSSTVYTVFLPLLEGQFRAALQGNDKDEIEICLESGDKTVQTKQGLHAVYMHAGANPFEVISQAVKYAVLVNSPPSFLDWFGWCTWDAFYTDVTAEGVDQGLRRFASRLTGIKENAKFQRRDGEINQCSGLELVVDEAKKHHNVRWGYVYVWHAMAGYWGGVKPAAEGMEHYESALAYPVQSPGVMGNQPDIALDSLSVHGLGLVHPKKVFSFYNELHAYLASCGVDGVKVDVQNIIETLGGGHGGRVSLTRAYHQALEASVARNFPDNGCISCMCHNTDGLYRQRLQLSPLLPVDDTNACVCVTILVWSVQREADGGGEGIRRLLSEGPGVAHHPHLLRGLQHPLPGGIHAARLGYVPCK